MKRFAILVLALLLLALMVPAVSSASETNFAPPYNKLEWMKYMPDEALISQLNIPGTHDSATGTINQLFVNSAKCQDWDITEQLENGFRVFDLRLRYALCDYVTFTDGWLPPEELTLCHGGLDCYKTKFDAYMAMSGVLGETLKLKNVLDICKKFLDAHPSECIILEMSHEFLPDIKDVRIDTDRYREIVKEGVRNILHYSGQDRILVVRKGDDVLTMKQARGKIIIYHDEDGRPYTAYENVYEDITPYEKANRVSKALGDAGVQDLLKMSAKFIEETQYEDQKTVGEPDVKVINTNATDVSGPASFILPEYGPKGYADVVNARMENEKWSLGRRYGWFMIDFPTEKIIKQIMTTNNNLVHRQQIVKWVDGKEHKLEDDIADGFVFKFNGAVQDLSKLDAVSYLSGNQGYQLTFAPRMAYEADGETIVHLEDAYLSMPGYYAKTLSEPVFSWELNESKNGYRMVATQTIEMRPMTETTASFDVIWDDKQDQEGHRPKDLAEFLQRFQILLSTNGVYSWPKSMDPAARPYITMTKENNVWHFAVHVNEFGPYGDELHYMIEKIQEIFYTTNWHKVEDQGYRSGVRTFRLYYDPEENLTVSRTVKWCDNNDQYGFWKDADAALGNDMLVHVQGFDSKDVVIWDANINARSGLNRYKSSADYYMQVATRVNGVPISYRRFEWPQTLPGYVLLPAPYGSMDEPAYAIAGNLNVKVEWDDDDNARGVRPSETAFDVHLMLTRSGDLHRVAAGSVSESDGWATNMQVPLTIGANVKEMLTCVTPAKYPYYSVSARIFADEATGLVRHVVIKYTYDTSRSVTIRGKVEWHDGSTLLPHPAAMPTLELLRSGAVVPATEHTNITWNGASYQYLHYPIQSGDKQEMYTIHTPTVYDGYDGPYYNGNDLIYTRRIRIGGKINTTNVQLQSPVYVQLLRDGQPVGDPIRAVNGVYAIPDKQLAASVPSGKMYTYSIRVTTADQDVWTAYDEPVIDTTTGDMTLNATMLPDSMKVRVPISLDFVGIDASKVENTFIFVVTGQLDDRELAQPVYLSRENGFTGMIELGEHMKVMNKTYTFEVHQLQNGDVNWQFDTHSPKIEVDLSLVDGKLTAKAHVIGTDREKTDQAVYYTNTYCYGHTYLKLTAAKQIDIHTVGTTVPATTFTFQLSQVLPDGSEKQLDTVQLTGEGQITFRELEYTEAGVYQYVVRETAQDIPGWQYDTQAHPIKVTVTNVGGRLNAVADQSPTIINVFDTVAMSLPVTVRWEDVTQDGPTIPESVYVTLYADGNKWSSTNVTEEGNWKYTFQNLPIYQYSTGEPINVQYTISAPDVADFTKEITGDMKTGFVVVYTAIPPVPPTGDETNLAMLMATALISFTMLVMLTRKRCKKS